MPYGYVATLLVWALVTAAMLRPPHRPMLLARVVYFLSVAANELPLLVLLLLGLSTVSTLSSRSPRADVSGLLALVLGTFVAAGLLVLQRRVGRARGIIAREVGLPLDSHAVRWAWLLPLPLRPRGVERLANLRYGRGGTEHLLDLYRPRDQAAQHRPGDGRFESSGSEGRRSEGSGPGNRSPAPVLIYFHGGGYRSGGKHFESAHLRHRMAQRGWVVLSANYGLRPRATWPEHLIDAKRVIAWVHENAAQHGMDPRRIVMSGSSAGAHLSIHCALTANDPALQPGFETTDTRLAAAVLLYGYFGGYYGRDAHEQPTSHPLDLPVGAAPPIVAFHGDQDNRVPVQQARDLVSHLRSRSPCAVAYAELPGAQHGFDVFASPRCRAVVDGIEHFLTEQVARPAPD
ncbi:MAG: alpha/beta hydrolase [Brachybacterium sp.]|uniref:alpha/beta hydrolase n=1 Tax=Brachybacterium sp. AOP29-B2-41 TaxID=3457704 RepID=UPI003FE13903